PADRLNTGRSGLQRREQVTAWLLPGAHHDMVHREQLLAAIDAYAQAVVVHAQVRHAAKHAHALGLERGAVDPAGGLAQPRTGAAPAALEQPDLARRRLGPGGGQAAAAAEVAVHAPFGHPALGVEAGGGRVLHQELGHVEPDAPRADDGDPAAGDDAPLQHVEVADDLAVVVAGEVDPARRHPVASTTWSKPDSSSGVAGVDSRRSTPVSSMRWRK